MGAIDLMLKTNAFYLPAKLLAVTTERRLPGRWIMQLSRDMVIGCLNDNVSIIQACDADFSRVEIVVVSRVEWNYWAAVLEPSQRPRNSEAA